MPKKKRFKLDTDSSIWDQKTSTSDGRKAKHTTENRGQLLRSPFVLQVFFILFFIITGFTLYSNTFRSPFVLDDVRIIAENPTIRLTELTPKNILNSAIGLSSNRPVSTFTFALNYYLDLYNPAGYHFVNIVIHILNAIILFFFLKLTFKISSQKNSFNVKYEPLTASCISFLAALIWMVNPLQTQSVTYIVQRMNSMAATFFILALLFYAKGRYANLNDSQRFDSQHLAEQMRKPPGRHYFWYLACGVSGLLALGSKESTATLPLFICLYEWYFFQNLSKTWIKSYLKYLIASVILVLLVAFVFLGFDPLEKLSALKDFANDEFTWSQRVLTQPRVVIYYISLLFFPHPSRLNLDYDFPLSYTLINPLTTLLSVIAIIGLVALSIKLAKKERLMSFCLLWFLGNLAIESSVIPLAIIFEHRTYLPSMLLFLIPITLGYRHIKFRGLKIGLLSMVVVIFAVWTYQRNQVWENEVILWTDVVKKSPNKARPHLNLGEILSKKGRVAEAAQQYRQALRINPRYAMAHFNMANVLQQQGSHAEAIKHYSTAIQIEPSFTAAHNNLGLALAKQGKRKEAIKHYLEILKIDPTNAKVHSNIGVALTKLGEIDQAISHFQQALDIDPADAEAHYNLAIALEIQQRDDEAVNHYLATLEGNPGNALAHFNAANIFARQQKIDEAIRHYEKSLAIQPDFPRAINNLALMYAMQKNYTKALSGFKDVLAYWPDKAETYYNVACMYSHLARTKESIQWLKLAVDKGYSNWESIKSDSDLDNIRDADAYKELVKGH